MTNQNINYPCRKGVTQGSLLSRLLFNLFFDRPIKSRLEIGLTEKQIVVFADDLTIAFEEANLLEKAINKIESFCQPTRFR